VVRQANDAAAPASAAPASGPNGPGAPGGAKKRRSEGGPKQ
jgi:hypothetical protein